MTSDGERPEPGAAGAARGFLGASVLVVAATTSGSVANFLFQWIAARTLSDGDFSLLAALLAVVTLAVLPGAPLSIAIVRRLAARGDRALPAGLAAARGTGIATGLVILGTVALLSTVVGGDRLHLAGRGGPLLWLAAAAAVVSWLAVAPELARAQAAGRFGRYGRGHALLSATRLGFGGGALLAGGGPGLAIAVLAIGPWLVRATLPRTAPDAEELRGGWLRTLLPLLAATGGLHALVVLDAVFVRVHFGESDPEGAGAYAACTTLARALYHLPFAATAVTVHRVARATARGEPRGRWLVGNLLLVTAAVGCGALVLGLFPETALRIFAGEGRYESAAPLLVRLLLPMALASIAAVPVHSLLAEGRRSPVVVLAVAPFVLAALLARTPERPEDLVPPLIGVQAATAGVLLALAAHSAFQSKGAGSSAGRPAENSREDEVG